MRETVEQKARRMLHTGAVDIVHRVGEAVIAEVVGDTGTYRVTHAEGRWECDCPSRITCAHIRAVERVTSKHAAKAMAA